MAIATKRNAHILFPPDHSKNWGISRLRIRVNITTKIGRLTKTVETKDTGPLSMACNNSAMPLIAITSVMNTMGKVEFLCLMSFNCLKKRGRNENENQEIETQIVVRENKFQDGIDAMAYLATTSASAKSRLTPKSRRSILPIQVVVPVGLFLIETMMAPATTMMIASHCR